MSTYVTVDNISSSGCKFYGAIPEGLHVDDVIVGKITLPTGVLPFYGRVAAKLMSSQDDEQRYTKGIGCHFDWQDLARRDQLDLFLYGSGLQWTLHDFSEKSLTPFQWLFKRFNKTKIIGHVNAEFWGAVGYRYEHQREDGSLMGLIANPHDKHGTFVITFTELDQDEPLVFTTYSRVSQPDLVKRVELMEVLESPSATLFVYRLIDIEQAAVSDGNE